MEKSFQTNGFKGMNNVLKKSPLSIPSMLLNAHVGADGALEKRQGSSLIAELPGAHALWTDGNGLVLCMAQGNLYQLVDKVPKLIVETGQPDSPVHYLVVSGRVYISNALWTGAYNIKTKELEAWGTPVPTAPILLPDDGSLPAGRYHVCVTVMGITGRPSGNSRMSSITLDEPGGIAISNLPENAQVWMTDPDGSQFFFAGTFNRITQLPASIEPIPTMWGSPPLPMSCLCWAFGRAWGFRDTRLYYSEPYQPELFCLSNAFFDFDSPGGMIAKTDNGLFIGTKDRTVFLAGRHPEEMSEMRQVAPGVVPGSLCYASDLGDLGRKVPIWIGKDGVYAGTSSGQALNLIKERIAITAEQSQGASIYRVRDGQTQMLFSYGQGGGALTKNMSLGDDATCEVVRKGSVI